MHPFFRRGRNKAQNRESTAFPPTANSPSAAATSADSPQVTWTTLKAERDQLRPSPARTGKQTFNGRTEHRFRQGKTEVENRSARRAVLW